MVSSAWLFQIPTALWILFYFAALLLLGINYRQCPSAARLAIVGVSTMLMVRVCVALLNPLLASRVDSESVPMVFGIVHLVGSLIDLVAFAIILVAIFTGRKRGQPSAAQIPVAQRVRTSDNPYDPPPSSGLS